MNKKNIGIGLIIASVGCGLTLAVQRIIPSKEDILEASYKNTINDIQELKKLQKIFTEKINNKIKRKNEIRCQLAFLKLSKGKTITKESRELCLKEEGL